MEAAERARGVNMQTTFQTNRKTLDRNEVIENYYALAICVCGYARTKYDAFKKMGIYDPDRKTPKRHKKAV